MPGRNINLSGIVCAKGKKMVVLVFTNVMPHKHTAEFQRFEFPNTKLSGDIS